MQIRDYPQSHSSSVNLHNILKCFLRLVKKKITQICHFLVIKICLNQRVSKKRPNFRKMRKI